ncbi:GNAT family N-acetyltransferase [Halonotius roseus]|uniref:GNAT family N-acetyltransferase n=1 Tax=Halonotius roseus TaxID=2511997 RepID=A0A544QS05_9EURY|nr:GNAT family N-acetyltransferase [Halonotius roseus]TQQ82234.1 GNAT family N-acetyltransferase [Halonotius roseus]
MSVEVALRRAGPDDHLAVVRLFDAGLLETDPDRLRRQLDATAGFVLLGTIDERPVGAVAVDLAPASSSRVDDNEGVDNPEPARITAIAVRRRRRDRGIGRQLVDAAADRVAPRPLTAVFDERVRPFYRACGFEIEPHEGRLRGCRWPTTAGTPD